MIYSTLACNLDRDLLLAGLPLFAEEKVDAIEWSFDTLFKVEQVPDWFDELLNTFSRADRMVGHGVFFSLFSGRWTKEQESWLQHLKTVSQKFGFAHVTEHFGFMTGEDFHKGAPISVPFNANTLRIGIDRLRRIQEACSCPVGLENLAFSYSLEEVKRHGTFLEKLVDPVNGFIILDLHNLYCQLHNFDLSFEELIHLYPLHLVREIHISGGSWEDSALQPQRKVRRDTHDQAVPVSVFELLKKSIPFCPNLKFVVLEQLGHSLKTEAAKAELRSDFLQMRNIVAGFSLSENVAAFSPPPLPELQAPVEDDSLFQQQMELSQILENAHDYTDARAQLSASSLAHSDWHIENWDPVMLETVLAIAQKWKDGFGN